jgi:hypothetical protein
MNFRTAKTSAVVLWPKSRTGVNDPIHLHTICSKRNKRVVLQLLPDRLHLHTCTECNARNAVRRSISTATCVNNSCQHFQYWVTDYRRVRSEICDEGNETQLLPYLMSAHVCPETGTDCRLH